LLKEGERGWLVMLKHNKLNILAALMFSVTMLSVGSRGQVLFLMFMLLPIVNTYYFHIRLKVLAPFIVVGVIAMGLLMLTRGTEYNLFQVSFGEALEYGIDILLESPNIFWMLLTDFVVNAKTLYESIDYTQVNGIIWGRSYIVYLFVFIPFGGSVLVKLLTGLDGQDLFSGYILTKYAEADYGLGTNLIADLYLNFSLPGVIIMMSLLGCIVTHFEKPISKYGAFIYLSFFANCIYMVRGDIFCWLTFFVYFVIFDWLMRLRIQVGTEQTPSAP
jgi:oligosaccharide repeat unit polymerase